MEAKALNINETNRAINIDVIFEQVAVGMVFTDIFGTIIKANKKFSQLLGYEQEELEGKPIKSYTYLEDVKIEVDLFQGMIERKFRNKTIEKRYLNKDGSIIWGQLTISGIYDELDQLVEFFCVVTDISKSKEAEVRNLNQTLLFATAMDSIPANVFIKDFNGCYIACNSKYAAEQNSSVEDMIGKQDTDFFDQEISSKYRYDDLRIMKTGIPEEIVEEYVSNNVKYWISTIKAPVTNEGKVIGIVGMFVDITQKKKFDEELAAHRDILLEEVKQKHTEANHAKEMMQLLFDTSVDLMCILDKDGMIKKVNPSWTIDLGWSEQELNSKSFVEVIHPDDLEDGLVVLQAIKNEHRIIDYELRLKCIDGSFKWFSWNFRLATNFVVASARNITAQRDIQAFLLESKDAAEKANKAKSEFIANMSHEIRTPLNAVIGFSELLALKLENTKFLSYVDSINLAGQSLLSLINDILDLSKIEADMMVLTEEKVNIRTLINEIVIIFNKNAKDKNLQIIVSIDQLVPGLLKFDNIRMRQVLLNLVGNAIKFTQKGSVEIKVKLVNHHRQKGLASIVISIIDTGIGINNEDYELIFDSFRQQTNQNSKKYGGTGLGLSISKKLIEMMGGYITVESNLGLGSTFEIHLDNIEVVKKSPQKITKEEYLLTSYEEARILAVDDEELNLLLINELLKDRGLIVDCVNTGEMALEYVEKYKYDLVIMDLVMPNMDGNKTSHMIKTMKNGQALPIICFSANITADIMSNSEKSIFDDFLSKPVSLRDLISLLNKYLNCVSNESVEKNKI